MGANRLIEIEPYHGYKVHVDLYGTFYAEIDGVSLNKTTRADIITYIDGIIAKKKKAEKRKFSIPVVTIEKESGVITGVHAGHGGLVTKPHLEDKRFGGSANLFLDCPQSRQLIDDLTETRKRENDLQEQLERFGFKLSHRYGTIDSSTHEMLMNQLEQVERLVKEHAASQERAKQ